MADDPSREDELDPETEKLRRELAKLRAVLAERRDDMVAAASRGAEAVAAPIKENPGVVGSVFLIGGIVGLLLGLAIGQSERNSGHWYDRYR